MGENLEYKNTVSADGQVAWHITYEGKQNGCPKIMIIGNSITRHEPAPAIGWGSDHGMAASCKENDYVHRLISMITEKQPDASFIIIQAAQWEFKYRTADKDALFLGAKGFHPDIIVTLLSENIPAPEFTKEAFIYEMGALHDYLSDGHPVRLIQGDSFFNNREKCEAIHAYCESRGADFVLISDLSGDKENLAIGKFEHEGIAHHPGDVGMKNIAERFFEAVKKYI